jgi:ribosomal protein L16/L10AE
MKPTNQAAAIRLENVLFETNGDQMETKTKKEAMA